MSERDRAVKPFQERALVRSSPNTSRNCPSEGSLAGRYISGPQLFRRTCLFSASGVSVTPR